VKNVTLIFLASIYLISMTEFSQFLKIPLLIEHYAEHKEKDQKLSLLKFLSMHYTNGDVKDADYDKDQKLPFKSHDGCIGMSLVSALTNSHSVSIRPVYSDYKTYSVYTEIFLSSAYLSSIWQPPKSC
jgi:hypothetical protein